MIYALCAGGGCLSDREGLNDDPLGRELFGADRFADPSQVGEWRRKQSEESLAALRVSQVYYLIAALAYNLMVAIKLLDLPGDCQGRRVKTLMKKRLLLP